MKLAPMTTARFAVFALSMIARLSAERAQVVHVGQVGTRQRKSNRVGAGGEQETVESVRGTVRELHLALRRVERRDLRVVHEIDPMLGVKARRAQRDPLLGRVAGEVVLREVRTIVRRVGLRVEHRDAPAVAEPAEHLGGALPAAPAPTMTMSSGALAGWRDDVRGVRRRSRSRDAALRLPHSARADRDLSSLVTRTRSPVRSTRQHATGLSAGAPTASPVRRLKHA